MALVKQKIDRELLLRVARNARLNLSEAEVKEFLPQFQEIISVFEKISRVDVKNIAPSFQPLLVENVFRKDVVEKSLSVEEALSNAVHRKGNFFKGPKVL